MDARKVFLLLGVTGIAAAAAFYARRAYAARRDSGPPSLAPYNPDAPIEIRITRPLIIPDVAPIAAPQPGFLR